MMILKSLFYRNNHYKLIIIKIESKEDCYLYKITKLDKLEYLLFFFFLI